MRLWNEFQRSVGSKVGARGSCQNEIHYNSLTKRAILFRTTYCIIVRPGSDLLIRTDYIWVMTDPEQDLAPRMFLEFVKTAKTTVGLFHQFELQSGHTHFYWCTCTCQCHNRLLVTLLCIMYINRKSVWLDVPGFTDCSFVYIMQTLMQ